MNLQAVSHTVDMLKKFNAFVRPQLSEDECLCTDVPGLRAQENPCANIPLNYVVTTSRPDMVDMNNTVVFIESNHPFQLSRES